MTFEVIDRPDRQRYELVDGDRVLGFTDYRTQPGDPPVLVFPHTVIEPAERGRGLGAQLVAGAMADVRRRGARVHPTCWYVAAWLDEHPTEQDLLA